MLLIIELPHDYPQENIPFMRLKNLSPNYLDNRNLDDYETQIRALARDNVGMPMVFTICEHLKEQIGEINDKVLNKYNQIVEAKRMKEEEDATPMRTNMDELDYTPVN
jgi:hypothetical protein